MGKSGLTFKEFQDQFYEELGALMDALPVVSEDSIRWYYDQGYDPRDAADEWDNIDIVDEVDEDEVEAAEGEEDLGDLFGADDPDGSWDEYERGE